MVATTPSFWAAKWDCQMAPFLWLNTPHCPMEITPFQALRGLSSTIQLRIDSHDSSQPARACPWKFHNAAHTIAYFDLSYLYNKRFGVKTKINIFFFFWACSRPEAKCQQPPFLTESFKPNVTYQIRYSYHTGRRACQPFLLYGHDGEATRWVNRFKTLQDCQSLCR